MVDPNPMSTIKDKNLYHPRLVMFCITVLYLVGAGKYLSMHSNHKNRKIYLAMEKLYPVPQPKLILPFGLA